MIGHRLRLRLNVLALSAAILITAGLAVRATPALAGGCGGADDKRGGIGVQVGTAPPDCMTMADIGKMWWVQFAGSYSVEQATQMTSKTVAALYWVGRAGPDPSPPEWVAGTLAAFDEVAAVSAPARPAFVGVTPADDGLSPLMVTFGESIADGIAFLVAARLNPAGATSLRESAVVCFRNADAALAGVAKGSA
jgi:hypothetical protein